MPWTVWTALDRAACPGWRSIEAERLLEGISNSVPICVFPDHSRKSVEALAAFISCTLKQREEHNFETALSKHVNCSLNSKCGIHDGEATKKSLEVENGL